MGRNRGEKRGRRGKKIGRNGNQPKKQEEIGGKNEKEKEKS